MLLKVPEDWKPAKMLNSMSSFGSRGRQSWPKFRNLSAGFRPPYFLRAGRGGKIGHRAIGAKSAIMPLSFLLQTMCKRFLVAALFRSTTFHATATGRTRFLP